MGIKPMFFDYETNVLSLNYKGVNLPRVERGLFDSESNVLSRYTIGSWTREESNLCHHLIRMIF